MRSTLGARQTQGYKGQGKKGMPGGHNQDCSFRFGNGPFWLVQYPIENLSQGEPAPTLGTFTFLSKVFYSSHVTQEKLNLDLETLIWFRNMLLRIYWLGTIDNIMNIHWALVGTWRHPMEYIWEHQIPQKIPSPSSPFASEERKLGHGLLCASCLNSYIGSQGFLFLIVTVTIFGLV
jgi:hypothetical protein